MITDSRRLEHVEVAVHKGAEFFLTLLAIHAQIQLIAAK
jgi:hypothetical protein